MVLGVLLLVGIFTHSQPRTPDASAPTGYRVPIHSADAAELRLLPGVGKKTASRIVAHREARGRFNTIEAMTVIPHIGDKRVEKIRPFAVLD